MKTLFRKIVDWHEKTFPDILPEKQREKLKEEIAEFETATTLQEKLEELADVYIVNAGLSRFFPNETEKNLLQIEKDLKGLNLTFSVLKEAVEKKLEKNKKRSWHIASGEYHHEGNDA